MSLDPQIMTAAIATVTSAITVYGSIQAARWAERRAARKADADVETAEIETGAAVERSRIVHDERVSPQLLRRIEKLEADRDKSIIEIRRAHSESADYARQAREALEALREAEQERRLAEDGCQARLDQLAAENEAQRQADAAKCAEEIAQVRAEVGALAAHAARREREQGREDTGVHQLETIARRTTTPLPQRLNLPAPTARAPLAGRMPRTTIRPPDEGGEE